MAIETYDVVTRTSGDCSMAVIITPWLLLYPNGKFIGQLRRKKDDPVVLYQWTNMSINNPHNSIVRVITAGVDRILLMKMPNSDMKSLGPMVGFYDVRIQDDALNARYPMFEGSFTILPGVTRQ